MADKSKICIKMALNQTNRLVWITKTIRDAGKISFEELNRKWVSNRDMSGGEEMLKRTFHKWRLAIADTFGIDIECEKGGQYRYYIANASELKNKSIENWLLSTYSVSNSLASSKSIKDRILLEEVPSGEEYLDPIIEAMKQNRCIHITYYRYWSEDEREYYLEPLCVKLFKQRWYMVARVWSTGRIVTFCLDRIRDFRLSSHTFVYPEDFSPEEYFDGCYGIINEKDIEVEPVRVKVNRGQANYLRDLPLMPGKLQREIERGEEYSIFEIMVRPCFDFQQELLWHHDNLEVLSPPWLREEIAGIVKRMWNKYNKEEK